jgi:O-methyltransferase
VTSHLAALQRIGLAAHSSWGDLVTSYELAARCIREAIPGNFVECGVFGGAQAAAMALAIQQGDPREVQRIPRRVHLFDTFAGMPEAGPQDHDWTAGGHKAGECFASLEGVQANMRGWGIPDELLVWHKGTFGNCLGSFHAELLGSAPPSQIAVLRLDLDLYEGTRAALQWLYPKLAPRGFCIIDDYALDGCRQAVNEYMGGSFPPITWQKP